MAGGIPFGFGVEMVPPVPRQMPQDIPAAPFGFAPPPSKWDQIKQVLWESNLNAPIRGAYNLMNTPYEVLAGGPSPEFDAAVGNSFDAAGGITVGSMPMPKPSNALTMGIKAYHGSPHSFDKFSMDKIGTGEGAQAYGHGLYFAENEGVANAYKNNLRRMNDEITFDGQPLKRPSDFTEIQNKLENGEGDWRLYKAVEEITARQGDMAERLADIRNWYRNQPEMLAAVDRAEKRMNLNANPGSVYEVNIDADPNTFLDWDKPLSEQPEAVQDFANSLKDKSFLARKRLEDTSSATGKDVWEKARNAFGVGQADAATKALAEAGIPGIKYLDAGSRGASDGTRNYVVFDDKLISIVRKYGIAGASALLGYNLLDGLSDAQAAELKKIEGK